MSMSIGTTYSNSKARALFTCEAYVDGNYVGEITDDRGTRRHVVPGDDHAEWEGPAVAQSEKFDVRGPDVPEVKAGASTWSRAEAEEANERLKAVEAKEERKAPKKR